MTQYKSFSRPFATLSLLGCALLVLAGCGLGTPAGPSPITPGAIAGQAHGGEQAIQGANVYLVYTGNSGYGTGDVIGGTATTSSDTNGSFTIATNSNTCTAPQQAYIVIQGGSTGAGTNANNYLVSAIGSCATLATTTFVDVNEVTTVAAAYALGNFATTNGTAPYVHIGATATNAGLTSAVTINGNTFAIGAGVPTTAAGLPHAFINAANLANITTGTAQSAPTVSSNVSVTAPLTMVNGIADILQSCVNSTGGSASSSSAAFDTPTTPTSTTASYASLVFNTPTTAINGTVDVNYGGTPLTGSISSTTSPATFASAFNTAFSGATDIVSFTTPTTPTVSTGATATVTGINSTTVVSGSVSISLAGGAPLTGTISSTTPATFVSSFNSNSSFSGAGIVASGTTTVTITGPVGTANTLSFSGSSLAGSGNALVATSSGNIVTVTGLSGTSNTLSFSGTSLTGVGGDGSACGSLFALTPSLSGSLPTNTFQAAANLAKNPWISTANVTSLYGLIPAQAAFTPYPPSAPSDYTLALLMKETSATYPTGVASTSVYPYRLTLDANDAVYVWQENTSSGTAGDTVSIGNYGTNAWVSQYTGVEATTRGIAADGIGNLWLTNYSSGGTMFQLNASTGVGIATKTTTYSTSGGYSYGVAVDRQNNVWVSIGRTSSTLQELPNTNVAPTAAGTYAAATTVIDSGETGSSSSTGGGGFDIAVDNFQNIWTADYYESSTAAGDQDTVMENVGTITAPCYTSYNASNTPACATSGSPTYYNYTLDGFSPSGLAFNQANYGTSPSPGSYSFTEYGSDTLTSITSTLTGTGTVIAVNQFPMTETVSSGGVLSISSTATNEPIPSSGTNSSGVNYEYAVYIAIDGAGYVYEPDFTNHGINVTKTTSTTPYYTSLSEPIGFYPCVQTTSVACGTAMGNLRQGQIDSTGSFWTTSSSTSETLANGVVEIIGTATPAWPLLAIGLNGVEP